MKPRHFYLPTNIRPHHGVTRRALTTREDEFRGTVDGIVACGLVPAVSMPGSPGMPRGSVCLHPVGHGGKRDAAGYMQVFVARSGMVRVLLAVDNVEWERREAIAAARVAAATAAADEILSSLSAHEHRYLRKFIDRPGGARACLAYMERPEFLTSKASGEKGIGEIRRGLIAYVDAQIERDLAREGEHMHAARHALERIWGSAPKNWCSNDELFGKNRSGGLAELPAHRL